MRLRYVMGRAVEMEILSADLPGMLETMAGADIPINDVTLLDELHIRCTVAGNDLPKVETIAEKRGDQIRVLRKFGLYYGLQALLHRKLLVAGLLFLLFLTFWVPNRVFFVQVEGAETVPVRQIMEIAAGNGLSFGAKREDIRSEKVKNALLGSLSQLQWAGVNTYGCLAVISVRERTAQEEISAEHQVSSIVAVCDGVVRQITTTRGNALCVPGQAVKRGEVLISAYTDCGICIQATNATGEIFADTRHRLTVIFPSEYEKRVRQTGSGRKISLLIGKNRINLSKDSGISGAGCAKIYEEYFLTLPGGFTLPIALCVEQWYDYDTEVSACFSAEQILSEFAAAYLPTQMVAGSVTDGQELFFHQEQTSILQGVYYCYEMIGRTRPEERLNG